MSEFLLIGVGVCGFVGMYALLVCKEFNEDVINK